MIASEGWTFPAFTEDRIAPRVATPRITLRKHAHTKATHTPSSADPLLAMTHVIVMYNRNVTQSYCLYSYIQSAKKWKSAFNLFSTTIYSLHTFIQARCSTTNKIYKITNILIMYF